MVRWKLPFWGYCCLAACWTCLSLEPAALAVDAPASPQPALTGWRQTLLLQLALEREGFSPGVIDGRNGFKTRLALAEFQHVHGLPASATPDQATGDLLQLSQGEASTSYTIQQADQDKVTAVPKTWQEKAKMHLLGYATLSEAVAEKFHCSPALLAQLNGGVDLAGLSVGDTLNVPALAPPKMPHVHHLQINFSQKVIRAFAKDGRLVALFHCSIAAKVAKRPTGSARVVAIAQNPSYCFDPAMWPEVKTVHRKLMIPPGPRNPVGLCWIALNLPGYGIHGTPNPLLIGKTGSHGCFRLTNWDAMRLGRMISPGAAITFVAQ